MPTCFVFLQENTIEDNYLSAVLDESNQLVAPLEVRTLEQIKVLQKNIPTYLILPSQLATFYHLAMPRQSSKKLNTAFQFFLETKIPQHLGNVHIAYEYDPDTESYVIILINKNIIRDLCTHLSHHHISFETMIVDASLLKPNEALYQENDILIIYDNEFHGAIPSNFIPIYESKLNQLDCYSTLPINTSWANLMTTTIIEKPTAIWLAKRANKFPIINIFQGEFILKRENQFENAKKWAIYLGIAWVMTFFIFKGIALYRLQTHNTLIQSQIMTEYKQLFPKANHVLNPKFQLTQYLKKAQTIPPLWQIIDALGLSIEMLTPALQSLSYQNRIVNITFEVNSFKDLEQLETRLKMLKIKVHQVSANQLDKHVQSTLDLSL